MEKESFEDEEVAEVLNKSFVSIKVDREERPDIDAVYMNVTQKITGGGGWPMTVIMTPDQKPFFAGTYIPKHTKYGRTGLLDLLEIVAVKWKSHKRELVNSGNEITEIIKSLENENQGKIKLTRKIIQDAKNTLSNNFDEKYGGFWHSPKFPQPSYLLFLLGYYSIEKDEDALYLVEKTLNSMFRGGIFDHVGNGFCRYSTDNKWLVPHFEKMLYDNALLAYTYVYAYQVTKTELYKNITDKIFHYILKEMTNEEGGFYSAQDADSEGEEGKYYVFTPEEIRNVLGGDDGEYFIRYYGITEKGIFEGKNIPNLINNDDYYIKDERIEKINKKLYIYRLSRTKLHKDDKILTSWNGMMIAAFAKAYKVLKEERYLQTAENAVNFIEKYMIDKDDNIGVRYRDGDVLMRGTLDDYAMYVWALIELYEATYNFDYIKRAAELNDKMNNLFWDDDSGGFFMNSREGEKLIYNPKETHDGAVPSGNSVAALNIFKLARMTGSAELEELAAQQMQFLSNSMADYPAAGTFALLSAFFELYPSKEIVCLIKNEEDFKAIKDTLSKNTRINNTVIAIRYYELERSGELFEFIRDYKLIDNKTTFYVCENKDCSMPFNDISKLKEAADIKE